MLKVSGFDVDTLNGWNKYCLTLDLVDYYKYQLK